MMKKYFDVLALAIALFYIWGHSFAIEKMETWHWVLFMVALLYLCLGQFFIKQGNPE